jgi:hypothetical protein
MAEEIIYISKQTTGTGLFLSDNEGHSGNNSITTNVNPRDTVTWQLKSGGGIDAITNIAAKATSPDIFSSDPAIQSDGSWKGTVSGSATGSESYLIGYKIGSTDYTDDPELDVQT